MSRLRAIVRHEFRTAAANKTFVVMTILGPFLILAVTLLPGLLSANPAALGGNKPVLILESEPFAAQTAAALESTARPVRLVADSDEAKKEVLGGKAAGFLAGRVLYTKTGTDAVLYGTLGSIVAAMEREEKIARSGLDPVLLRTLLETPELEVVRLQQGGGERKSGSDEFLSIMFTVLGFVMLLYMTILLYGQMIGRSVVLEKTSKTVEIMLSSVTPRELMYGKILGIGLAGIVQYAIWIGVSLALVKFAGPSLGLSLPREVSSSNLGWLFLFFILAFFLYASGYAAIAAASEDEHHLGQLAWPLIAFLIVPVVLISPLVMNPQSPLSVGLSIFPMTSPIVMLIRIMVSPPPAWQIALCIALLAATAWGMATAAARIFRTGILMTGKRANFKEISRWLRIR
ncbi:MAG: ABC transporter permease [Rectinemataceae bacterium]